MFVVGSLLEAVAARCGLPYASVICELDGHGAPVYGIELALGRAARSLLAVVFISGPPPGR